MTRLREMIVLRLMIFLILTVHMRRCVIQMKNKRNITEKESILDVANIYIVLTSSS